MRIPGAESCIGGMIAAVLTSVKGISNVFEFSVVSYVSKAKSRILKVPQELIVQDSTVSAEVA